MLPSFGWEDPVRTPGKEKQASSVPAFGGADETKKARPSLLQAASPVESGVAGFPSGCRLLSGSAVDRRSGRHLDRRLGAPARPGIDPKTLAAVRPLVQDAHQPARRPQARAKLGRPYIGATRVRLQALSRLPARRPVPNMAGGPHHGCASATRRSHSAHPPSGKTARLPCAATFPGCKTRSDVPCPNPPAAIHSARFSRLESPPPW